MIASRTRPFLVALVGLSLLLTGPVAAASAHDKPPGGKWNIQNAFDYTTGGAMKLSSDGKKLTTLVLSVGPEYVEDCGAKVRLVGTPKLKSFAKASGRWAIGKQQRSSSLIAPVTVTLKVAGTQVKGKLLMLFDETGQLVSTGDLEFGDCDLSFHARKAR